MTTYMPRTSWTRHAAAGSAMPTDGVQGIACHWPGSAGPIPAHAVASTLEGYRKFHTGGRGWSDIAYQVAIDQTGRVWDLRGIDRMSAGNGDRTQNQRWGAVLFLVGPGERPTTAATAAFRDWRSTRWLKKYPNAKRVVGHRNVRPDPTECPGDQVMDAINSGQLTAAPDTAPTTQEDDVALKDEILINPISKTPESAAETLRWMEDRIVGRLEGVIAKLAGQVAGLRTAVAASTKGQAIDLKAVENAAREGAEDALNDRITDATVNLTATTKES